MYMGLQTWSNYLITDYAHRNSDKTHIVMQIVSFPNAWWSWGGGGGGDGHLSWIMLLVGSDFFMLEARTSLNWLFGVSCMVSSLVWGNFDIISG